MPEIFSKRRMVSENKGNPFVDLFFFVLQIISVTCNFTSLWKKALRIHWSELRYLDLHQRLASVNHVVTSAASAVSNCNTHKCSITRRHERSIRSFAMSIAKHLMWFTSLTVTSVGRNTTLREIFWIRELRTLHPEGINKKAYIFCFD
jgi:hypothetical protein